MNKTVAKRIRKYVSRNTKSSLYKAAVKALKRDWNNTPWNLRHRFAQELE